MAQWDLGIHLEGMNRLVKLFFFFLYTHAIIGLEKQHPMSPPPSVPATSSSSTTSNAVAIPSVSFSLFRQALALPSYVYTLPTTAGNQVTTRILLRSTNLSHRGPFNFPDVGHPRVLSLGLWIPRRDERLQWCRPFRIGIYLVA